MHNSLINGNHTIYPSSIEHAEQQLYFSVFSIAKEETEMYISLHIYHLPVSLSIHLSSLST